MRRGTSLQANITIVDDVDPTNSETTGWIDIPDTVHSLPGVLPQQFSYNGSTTGIGLRVFAREKETALSRPRLRFRRKSLEAVAWT